MGGDSRAVGGGGEEPWALSPQGGRGGASPSTCAPHTPSVRSGWQGPAAPRRADGDPRPLDQCRRHPRGPVSPSQDGACLSPAPPRPLGAAGRGPAMKQPGSGALPPTAHPGECLSRRGGPPRGREGQTRNVPRQGAAWFPRLCDRLWRAAYVSLAVPRGGKPHPPYSRAGERRGRPRFHPGGGGRTPHPLGPSAGSSAPPNAGPLPTLGGPHPSALHVVSPAAGWECLAELWGLTSQEATLRAPPTPDSVAAPVPGLSHRGDTGGAPDSA